MAFNDMFRFGAHAIVFNADGDVLMLKKTYGDKGWSFPGGSVNPGETIHQALYRECREEIGVDIQNVVLTGFYYHSKINAQVGIFRSSIPADAPITLSSEHSEYKWIPLSEMAESHRIRAMDASAFQGEVASRVF
ncbi:NUDIX hydrolase [Paenibacillus koleovorans]|uniref:NUDIX hydrolase n=1 Tax=Paenibacillus koleovorans TaxID=121608 RepID=UPI000FDB40CC|nr:NUDIX domain-containing protein [Paenibacillus koleovorans]